MEISREAQTQQKPIRLDYLDIAKFLAIILVILGHTTGNFDTPFYRLVLYAFHMPLFFIVSGVVVRKHRHEYNLKHWLTFLRKNILALVVPYIIWGLIYGNFAFGNFWGLIYGSRETLGQIGTLTSLWFIPTLFVARILVEIVMMLSSFFEKIHRHLFAFIFSIILFTVGFLLPHPENGYPWCLDVAFVAAGFILLGYSIKDILSSIYKKSILLHVLILLVSLGLFIFGILIQKDSLHLILMCSADYGNIGFFLLTSLSGSLFLLSLAIIITKLFENNKTNIVNRFMLWVGRSTLGIYLVHKNFLQEVCMETLKKWGATLPNLGFAIIATIVAFIFSVLVVFVIDRYIPQLFGKFSSKKIVVLKGEDCQNQNN